MIKFFKMNGVGNDYIFIDNLSSKNNAISKKIIKKICDRHFGVGGDGVIVISNSKVADVKMKIYNSDASTATLCGNATRCVAFYIGKKLNKYSISIESGEKILYCQIQNIEGDFATVSVNMGKANMLDTKILTFKGQKYKLYIVDVGNLHCVTFVKDFCFDVQKLCSAIQNLPCFENGINVDVAMCKDDALFVKVCERGSGFTLACGSGACASAYTAKSEGLTGDNVMVCQDGGKLEIDVGDNIIMTGSCKYVFDGVFYEDK